MLTPERITELHAKWKREPNSGWKDFARTVEAEVRKEDADLIRQMLEAAELGRTLVLTGGVFTAPELALLAAAVAAARARLLDSDLSHLTERGKEAWKGVDPQKLRETGAL